jgi:hypothetical protein
MHTCPCCGYKTLIEPPGSHDICAICFWEDDIVQLAFPDCAGGPNKCSLIEGQQNFDEFGACERRVQSHVRTVSNADSRDMQWRRIDVERDQFLKWDKRADHDLWQTVKDLDSLCLNYWSPDFRLLRHSR